MSTPSRSLPKLFWRIFLWYWATTSALLVVLTLFAVVREPSAMGGWRVLGETLLEDWGRRVAAGWEKRGEAGAREVLEQYRRAVNLEAELQSADGRTLASTEDGAGDGAGLVATLPVVSADGTRYVLRTGLPPRRFPRLFWSAEPLWPRAGLLLLTAGLICLALARGLTAPLSHIASTARQFAAGRLASRVVDAQTLRRADEFGELGREFNVMAAQIEAMVAGRERLFADISHELRSPLGRARMALGLLEQRHPGAEARRMDAELRRIDGLIEELLELSQVRTAPLVEAASFFLGSLLAEAEQDGEFEASASGRRVKAELPEPDVVMTGHREMLRRALENLIRNALRYTAPATCVEIACTVTPQDVEVAVADRGPGLPEAELGKIFEPFYRVDAARDPEEGSGLGLAIVRETALRHGGSVRAENREGGGLCVTLRLPSTLTKL